MKKRKKYASGSITILLSLVMSCVLIMTTALTELSRTTIIKAQMAMDCQNALGSALAEYNRPLLERYNIFGLDGAYGGSSFNAKKIADRMKEYMPGLRGEAGLALAYGGDITLDNYLFLTDKCGNEVYEQAVTYMKKTFGLDILAGLTDVSDLGDEDEESGKEIVSGSLGNGETGGILSSLGSIRSQNVLSLIFGSTAPVSSKSVPAGQLLTNRRSDLFKGAGMSSKSVTDKLLFQEYLFRSFTCYTTVGKGKGEGEKGGVDKKTDAPHALDYEIEHIFAGKGNDKENLGAVARKLVLIRDAMDFIYIQTDEAKCGEAHLLALALCTVTVTPEAIEAVKQAILAAWSYAEAICEVRTLLKGGKVPLIKTGDTWKTGIMSIFNPGGTGVLQTEEGIDYETYLRGLLLLRNEADKCGRAMDIMEQNIRKTEHYGSFGMDNCLFGFSMQGNFKVKHIFTTIGQTEMDYGGSISYEMLEKRK